MKLALVNPNTSPETTHLMVDILAEAAGAEVLIEGHTAQFGAPLITDPAALSVAADAVLALAPSLRDADAVIVAAFGDPGLDALRDVLTVPVTGIAEAGMMEAAEEDRRLAVVTTTPDLKAKIADTARRHGHASFVGTWTTPGDPAALTANPTLLETALADAIQAAVREGGAEAVVIGGGPLARAARSLAGTSPVPLNEPLPAAFRLSLARLSKGVSS